MGKQDLHWIKIGPSGKKREMFAIDASTKASELCATIAKQTGIKSADGFSLFVRIQDRAVSIKDDQFFFDFIRQLSGLN